MGKLLPDVFEHQAGSTVSTPSLRSGIAWNLLGHLVYGVSLWGVLVVLARYGEQTLGTYAYALALTAPVFALTNANLRVVLATDTSEQVPVATYLAHRLIGIAATWIVVVGVLVGTGRSAAVAAVAVLVTAAKSVESVSDVVYGLFLRRGRMDVFAASLLLRGPALVLVFGAALGTAGGLPAAVIGQIALWGSVLAFHDLPRGGALLGSSEAWWPRFDGARLRALTRTAAPLGVVSVLGSLVFTIPVYVIEVCHGIDEVGRYSALAYCVQAGQFVVFALGYATSPRLADRYARGDVRGFLSLAGWMLAIHVGLAVGGMLAAMMVGGPVLLALYGPSFADQVPLLVAILGAGGLGYVVWFVGSVLNAMRRFDIQVPVSVAQVVVLGCGCVAWVPTWGGYGAAGAWALSGVVYLCLAGWAAAHRPRRQPERVHGCS